MAKKAPVAIDLGANLQIKLADGKKSKAEKPDRLTIESPKTEIPNPKFDATQPISKKNPEMIEVPTVDKCVEMSHQIENLETELRIYETSLIEKCVADKKKAADDDDKFVKTVDIMGTALKMQVQFRDSYSSLDVAMEPALKEIFTDKYPTLFAKNTGFSLRSEKLEELKTLLGDKFEIFFNKSESLQLADNFQATFFGMRKSFKPEQEAVIEKIKAAIQSKPAIKYPK
jgi:hypothetical protein